MQASLRLLFENLKKFVIKMLTSKNVVEDTFAEEVERLHHGLRLLVDSGSLSAIHGTRPRLFLNLVAFSEELHSIHSEF